MVDHWQSGEGGVGAADQVGEDSQPDKADDGDQFGVAGGVTADDANVV